jgi:hypothetical protein
LWIWIRSDPEPFALAEPDPNLGPDNFLGNKTAFNIKKARYCIVQIFLTAIYGQNPDPDLDPNPDPKIFQSLIRNKQFRIYLQQLLQIKKRAFYNCSSSLV